tara:strand:+ start:248 stop:535 length:288 start_codon:yes stop_codon:yes gene_type:complete
MGETFLQQIDDELSRLKGELDKVKENMESAQKIFEDAKIKQARLVQELKAVDMMGSSLKKVSEPESEELQQPEQIEQPEPSMNSETEELDRLENE